jgi:hypothetical protein
VLASGVPATTAADTAPAIVTIPAAKCFLNYTFGAGMDLVFSATDTAGPTGLATDGDLLAIECPDQGSGSDTVLVPYRESDGTALDVALAEGWFLLGGRLVAFAEDSDGQWAAAFVEAMASLGPEGLRDLRLVRLAADLAPGARTALEALAAQVQEIDVAAVAGVRGCADLLARFRPRLVVIEHASAEDLAGLSGSSVEGLFLSDPETLDLAALARLPRLRSLVLLASGSGGTVRLPRKGLPLERLVLRCEGLDGIAHLDAQRNLRHLVLTDPPPGALRQVRRLPCLEGLVVALTDRQGEADLRALEDLAGLTMLGLQGPVPQADFERLVAANPGISVLELLDCDAVADLSAVRWLPELRALVCRGSSGPAAEVLAQLPHLRLLALGSDEFSEEKAEQLLGLGERLPECRIAPVRGLCLGSGWILLLVPLTGALWGVLRALEDRRAAATC